MTPTQLKASRALWKRRHTYRDNRVRVWTRKRSARYAAWQKAQKTLPEGSPKRVAAFRSYEDATRHVIKWESLRKEASDLMARRDAQIAANKPLREKALAEAQKLVGIMEFGGNNRGREVEKIIKEGGGLPGQAWCGWFCAAVYKRAGSKAVNWRWGAVRLFVPLSGISRASKPQPGDLVRFTFDHIGMFVKDNGNGTITTVEGNTGATGAVSDSVSGGDGVYTKVRPKSLVRDYLRVTR